MQTVYSKPKAKNKLRLIAFKELVSTLSVVCRLYATVPVRDFLLSIIKDEQIDHLGE